MFYDPPRPRCVKLIDGHRCMQPKHDESKPCDPALFPWPGETRETNRGERIAVDGRSGWEARWGTM